MNVTALARSVSGLAKAETEHQKWAEHVRAGVAAALAFFASRTEPGEIAYLPVFGPGKHDGFERRSDPFGAPPADEDFAGTRVRGF